jgi:hypothetical protein
VRVHVLLEKVFLTNLVQIWEEVRKLIILPEKEFKDCVYCRNSLLQAAPFSVGLSSVLMLSLHIPFSLNFILNSYTGFLFQVYSVKSHYYILLGTLSFSHNALYTKIIIQNK